MGDAGLVDCHTHLVYAGCRSDEFAMRLSGTTYSEIAEKGGGINSTVQATRAANEDALFRQSARRLETLLAEGVTAVEIKSGYGLNLETERKYCGSRAGSARPIRFRSMRPFSARMRYLPEFAGRGDHILITL